MNDLLNLLKSVAPTLATAVAGPLGGAAVSMLASKFGVSDSVEAVAKAIAGDPAAAQKLAELELEMTKVAMDAQKNEDNNITATKNLLAAATVHEVPYFVGISSSVVNSMSDTEGPKDSV